MMPRSAVSRPTSRSAAPFRRPHRPTKEPAMATTLPVTQRTMTAVVKRGPGPDGVELREVPVPQVLPGLAEVRVTATGLCGTDVHVAHDEYGYEAPVVMGHEISGTVVGVGS